MKKLAVLFAAIIMAVLLAFSSSALEETGQCGENVYWNFNESTGELVISGTGDMDDDFEFALPVLIENRVTSIVIENGVTSIGSNAFLRCGNIESITIPESVISIGDDAFVDCYALTGINVDINNKHYSSDSCGVLFNKDKSLLISYPQRSDITSYTIPNSVTSIGDKAFYFCFNLKSITIPESVTSIGDEAFYGCYALTSITIPESVTNIGDEAFRACLNLGSIEVDINNKHYSSDSYGVLYNKDKSLLIRFPCRAWLIEYPVGIPITSYTISDSVIGIGDGAFDSCNLETIIIPESVTSIGDEAFYGCYDLTSITIPESVTSIGDEAFYACKSLKSIEVDINNKHYSSDSYGVLFNKDKTLLIKYPSSNIKTSYTIPDSVTSIGDKAFYSFYFCCNLKSITIPESVTSIGDEAFYGCYTLTSITIPESVISIGDDAFVDCDALTGINVDINNKHYSSDSYGVLFNKDKTLLIKYPSSNIKTSYTIPDSVTSMSFKAFEECRFLESLTIGKGITTIDERGFYLCASIRSVTIPDSLTTIGDNTFHGFLSLADIYYKGSEKQWNNINISEKGKQSLYGVTIHYEGDDISDDYDDPGLPDDTETSDPYDEPNQESLSFFEKIVEWFRNIFDKLFGWLKK